MIITDQSIRALDKGFQKKFLGAIGKVSRDAERLAMKTTSSQAAEVYGDIAFFPSMRQLIGEVVVRNLKEVGWTIPNQEYEATVAVKQASIERDSFGIYSPAIAQLGTTGAKLGSKLIADLLMNGFTAKDYTGLAYFATNKIHFPGGRKTFSNKGTKKLSAANYQTGRAAIRSLTDEDGVPLELGDETVLVVSPQNEALGKSIVVSEHVNGGDTNVNKGTSTLMVMPRLATAPDNWFIVDVSQALAAFILQEERALELLSTATSMTTEQLILTHKYLWQAYWRGAAAYGLWQLAYGSTGVDAA